MPNINVSEDDFLYVAWAANDAMEQGDEKMAKSLDKLARKINAALTANCDGMKKIKYISGRRSEVSWKDMPSTLIKF